MISNLDQLKNFIMWCKDNKIKDMELKDIKFSISELDFIPEASNNQPLSSNLGEYNTSTLTDTMEESTDWRDDPDLFHSAN
jgi:hypothetical protein